MADPVRQDVCEALDPEWFCQRCGKYACRKDKKVGAITHGYSYAGEGHYYDTPRTKVEVCEPCAEQIERAIRGGRWTRFLLAFRTARYAMTGGYS